MRKPLDRGLGEVVGGGMRREEEEFVKERGCDSRCVVNRMKWWGGNGDGGGKRRRCYRGADGEGSNLKSETTLELAATSILGISALAS